MLNKFLLSTTLMVFLMTPAISYACNAIAKNVLDTEKTEFSALNSGKTAVFNFRTEDCPQLNDAQRGIRVNEFFPTDETTLGIFQYHIDKGESQYEDLVFNISEEESQRTSASPQGIRQFNINEE